MIRTSSLFRLAVLPALCTLLAGAPLAAAAGSSAAIYPGATKLVIPGGMSIPVPNTCGSKTIMDIYKSKDGAPAISRWYRAHSPGFTEIKGTEQAETHLLADDGSGFVSVRGSSVDPTSIAIVHYQPVLGATWASAMRNMKSPNPAAKAASTATLKATCMRE